VRKTISLALLLVLLVIPLGGCQQTPKDLIQVHDPQFKYRGSLVWLYEDADGEINMLRGNYRAITAYTVADSSFSLFNKGTYLAGKGKSQEVANVGKNQLIYVREQELAIDQQKEVIKQPDYVLSVDIKQLANKLPQVKNAAELEALREAFAASMELDKNPVVTITMHDGGRMQLELYPDIAPNTVNNFISLVQQGFYNGLVFHRIVPGFMIQGGDPQGNNMGGLGYAIKGEFAANGFNNNLLHTRGVVSMARAKLPDTAGSQFFIVVEDYPSLDGQYAAFGKLISGHEVADRIVALARDENERPLEPPQMQSVVVDVFDVTYPAPKTIAR
jgi:peptidyl-prolyl cis-trans isomerase B (cyclophilin B)